MVCATKVAALSTSLMVRVPVVVSGALVSLSVTLAEDSTAASLLPVRVIVTVCGAEVALPVPLSSVATTV
ncbi:hypothetical protein D3C76_1776880 [compost metagenome]